MEVKQDRSTDSEPSVSTHSRTELDFSGGTSHQQLAPSKALTPCLTIEDCICKQELCRGRYSIIYTAYCEPLHHSIAIKQYDGLNLQPKKQKMATREAIVLKYLRCHGIPNITHLWSAYHAADTFYLLMDYCQQGDLSRSLKARAPACFSEEYVAAMHALQLILSDYRLDGLGVKQGSQAGHLQQYMTGVHDATG
eukprot:jgi/Chrzof1/8689/Cz03g20180.t1